MSYIFQRYLSLKNKRDSYSGNAPIKNKETITYVIKELIEINYNSMCIKLKFANLILASSVAYDLFF